MVTIPVHNKILAATGVNGLGMKFRCRIFENPPMTIALLTDFDDANPGPSITNSIEYAVGAQPGTASHCGRFDLRGHGSLRNFGHRPSRFSRPTSRPSTNRSSLSRMSSKSN
jgi:hypothetical protein